MKNLSDWHGVMYGKKLAIEWGSYIIIQCFDNNNDYDLYPEPCGFKIIFRNWDISSYHETIEEAIEFAIEHHKELQTNREKLLNLDKWKSHVLREGNLAVKNGEYFIFQTANGFNVGYQGEVFSRANTNIQECFKTAVNHWEKNNAN